MLQSATHRRGKEIVEEEVFGGDDAMDLSLSKVVALLFPSSTQPSSGQSMKIPTYLRNADYE